MKLEQNEGKVIESEDGKASYESEENQEQDVERNSEPQHKRPDLIPDLTFESEMELEQDGEEILEADDERPSCEPEQNQAQDMETQTKFQNLPELKHLPVNKVKPFQYDIVLKRED
ncbi:uncharacterized protein [Porites lutea]|uniref:uncharacterized protein n=1 Tax=Porites lutea TaxID=51062 RepID=UPI003CC67F29